MGPFTGAGGTALVWSSSWWAAMHAAEAALAGAITSTHDVIAITTASAAPTARSSFRPRGDDARITRAVGGSRGSGVTLAPGHDMGRGEAS